MGPAVSRVFLSGAQAVLSTLEVLSQMKRFYLQRDLNEG